MIQCPACRKENPAGSPGCECGYGDLTGEVVKDGTPPASAGAPTPFADAPAAAIDYRLEFRGTAGEYVGAEPRALFRGGLIAVAAVGAAGEEIGDDFGLDVDIAL